MDIRALEHIQERSPSKLLDGRCMVFVFMAKTYNFRNPKVIGMPLPPNPSDTIGYASSVVTPEVLQRPSSKLTEVSSTSLECETDICAGKVDHRLRLQKDCVHKARILIIIK